MSIQRVVSRRVLSRKCRGLTLVELLVVITIVLLLVASTVPVMLNMNENRRIREGSRLVRSAFGQARTKAIESGRSIGILLEPADPVKYPSEAFVLYYAEVPPVYGGETADTKISVDSTGLVTESPALSVDFSKISIGDTIKFNYQGKTYRIDNIVGNTLTFSFENKLVSPEVTDVPFQVFRRPFKSKRSIPVQLPKGVVVDITSSGIGNNIFEQNQSVSIIFSPNGLIEQIYSNQSEIPASLIYILIADVGTQGSADLGELWITIGHQTGTIITSQVAAVDPEDTETANIVQTRKYARERHILGG